MVHLTLRGLRFILKFLWHLDRQKRKICKQRTERGRVGSAVCGGARAAAAAPGCLVRGASPSRHSAQM